MAQSEDFKPGARVLATDTETARDLGPATVVGEILYGRTPRLVALLDFGSIVRLGNTSWTIVPSLEYPTRGITATVAEGTRIFELSEDFCLVWLGARMTVERKVTGTLRLRNYDGVRGIVLHCPELRGHIPVQEAGIPDFHENADQLVLGL